VHFLPHAGIAREHGVVQHMCIQCSVMPDIEFLHFYFLCKHMHYTMGACRSTSMLRVTSCFVSYVDTWVAYVLPNYMTRDSESQVLNIIKLDQ
jgi:hypothetical protein